MVEQLDWYLYSIIESLKKNHEIAGFIPNPLYFHEKNWKRKSRILKIC